MIDIDNPDIVRILRLTKMRADVQTERNRIRHRLNYWDNIYKSRKLMQQIEAYKSIEGREEILAKLKLRFHYSKKVPKKHLYTKFNVLRKKVIELKYDYAKIQLEICNLTHDTSAELRELLKKNELSIHRKIGGALISHIRGQKEKTERGVTNGEVYKVEEIEQILLDKDIEDILLRGVDCD